MGDTLCLVCTGDGCKFCRQVPLTVDDLREIEEWKRRLFPDGVCVHRVRPKECTICSTASETEQSKNALREIREMLRAGQFGVVDDLLMYGNLERMPVIVMLAYLAATFTARHELKQRAAFFERVEQRLQVIEPERAKSLLKGLCGSDESHTGRKVSVQ